MDSIQLMRVPFDETYENVIDFDSETKQREYFDRLTVAEFTNDNISVIKEYERVKVRGNYNELAEVNYCYFSTTIGDVSRGWYAFVREVTYVSPTVVALKLSIDVWQSYTHQLRPCFVARGHVLADKAHPKYLYTPENVDVGTELIHDKVANVSRFPLVYWLVVVYIPDAAAATLYPFGNRITPFKLLYVPIVDNDPFGLVQRRIYIGSKQGTYFGLSSLSSLYKGIVRQAGHVFAIYATREIPFAYEADIVQEGSTTRYDFVFGTDWEKDNTTLSFTNDQISYEVVTLAQKQATGFNRDIYEFDISDFITSKLDCYPYKYIKITSNRGGDYPVKVEHVQGDKLIVKYAASFGATCKEGYSVAGRTGQNDVGYLAQQDPDSEQTVTVNNTILEMPIISDAYIEYMRTNKASMQAAISNNAIGSIFNATGSLLGGLATGNPIGAGLAIGQLVGGLGGMAKEALAQDAKRQDLQSTPDTVKKAGNDYLFEQELDTLGLQMYIVHIPEQERERLANYFNAFGYTMNDVVQYDTRSFTRWNYVQTANATIDGEMPDVARRKLKDIYNSGVRIWHDRTGAHVAFLDYTQSNEAIQ